jgi:hypothetical protein
MGPLDEGMLRMAILILAAACGDPVLPLKPPVTAKPGTERGVTDERRQHLLSHDGRPPVELRITPRRPGSGGFN